MQSRLPLRSVAVSLWVLLGVRATPTCSSFFQARGDDGDDGNDGDNDNGDKGNSVSSSSQHRFGCTNSNSISKGAIAGIVIGCLAVLALLALLAWWCMRRRRARSNQRLDILATPVPEAKPEVPSTRSHLHSAPAPMLGSPIVPGPVHGTANTVGQQQDQVLNNVPPGRPSVEFLTLPNPYERDVLPVPPPHDNIASPISPFSHRASAYTNPSLSSHSHMFTVVPSAWPFEDSSEALLSRGTTGASHLTTSSGLHEDLVGYQKALEAHHRKEEEDLAQGEGGSSQARAVPEDPPPIYPGRE